MRATPERTDRTAAEGIHPHEMTEAETAEVARTMADHLAHPRGDRDGTYAAPITPGTVRASRSGALWVTWARGMWFRLMDIPANPDEGFIGARIVWDAEGHPLGCIEGPLVLSEVKGRPTAFCINTGCAFTAEVYWD